MAQSTANLVAATQRYYREPIGRGLVVAAFRDARVAFQRPTRPGAMVVVRLTPSGSWLWVWTSLEQMWTAIGRCDYAVTTGLDLIETVLSVLPNLAGITIDTGTRHMVPLERTLLLDAHRAHTGAAV